ncbi:MAG: zf-HC2 domain-containing protein [Acidobacteria bacterium]|nr:zf-HC2 domain-containing protein [Acidobacteriota bacterium]
MQCTEVQSRLSEYLDFEVETPLRLAICEHLESCEVCRERLESMRGLSLMLRNVAAPVPPADLAHSTLMALDREVEPEMTIVTRRHSIIRPHYLGSRFDVIRQIFLDYEFTLVSYGIGATLSFALFAVLLAAARPLMSVEPFVPSAERLIWVSPAEGRALGGDSDLNGHSLARVADADTAPSYAASPSLVPSDDLVVLAEVSVDGRASILGVLSGPEDLSAVNQLAVAMNRPRSFVPARGKSGRPVVSRVVLFLGRMDIPG